MVTWTLSFIVPLSYYTAIHIVIHGVCNKMHSSSFRRRVILRTASAANLFSKGTLVNDWDVKVDYYAKPGCKCTVTWCATITTAGRWASSGWRILGVAVCTVILCSRELSILLSIPLSILLPILLFEWWNKACNNKAFLTKVILLYIQWLFTFYLAGSDQTGL